jgi:protein-S-isoprenylcysteine O-methyltransferase Ste14
VIWIEGAIGVLMVLAGYALRVWAMNRLAAVGIKGEQFYLPSYPERWLWRGPFRLRHPCYIGSLMMIAGLGICVFGWPGVVLAVPAVPFFEERIRYEQAIEKHGLGPGIPPED